ncbi:MAG: (2Fe-2S) ferredoxin domain-containing protein [Leptolyngbyaceae cyanobacterium CRU_2_3]|nr:(2Fe-2S) ferredoxin domain-containing protein [Leptolyngbyaceae cyanobacterium CRU_2_3]
MVQSEHNSPIEFNFEGQFLGFVRHDGKLKYLRLRMSSEEIQIKLPKAVRIAGGLSLQPGSSIRVNGLSKCDRHTHQLKYKATQIIPLTEHSRLTPLEPATPAALVSSVIHQSQTKSKIKPKIKPKIKVLVCQKSGCLKRGGKGLCEAIAQILGDRHLEPHVTIERTGCLKHCSAAPNLVIMPGNHRYTEVHPKMLPRVADAIAQSLARY